MEKNAFILKSLSHQVLGCAIEVHKQLGPGLLESTYSGCLAHEMSLAGIPFEKEKPMPVRYKGTHLDCGYRLDFLVDRVLVLELKAVDKVLPIHHAQILSYLKLAKARLGLLLNFNVNRMKDGIQRFVL